MFRITIYLVLSVLCVNTQSDDGFNSRSYARVKRGKYPGPPIRFYNRPPLSFPIIGPFSYTPPPFMVNDEPQYPGSRPYKVSKPTNNGFGENEHDINNLVQHLSKQDLDKIIDFANEKGKYKDYKYSQSQKKGNILRPYQKDYYKGKENSYEMEYNKYMNYVTQATPLWYEDIEQNPVKVYNHPQGNRLNDFKGSQQDFRKAPGYDFRTSQNLIYPQKTYFSSIPESNEEEKLPPPVNVRSVDFKISYTNNVPAVVEADSTSYKVENFGDLPLMDYNSKLHSVSSYHVPQYTVTQSKSAPPPQLEPSLSPPTFSSPLLKPSAASASIKAPPYEPAPPASAAKQQSDAHLKATKIWSHRSKGAAYTLHDDGTLTPESPR